MNPNPRSTRPGAGGAAPVPAAVAVAVDVADPELDADVRAVLAALALEPRAPGGAHADVLVTDRADAATRAGGARVVRVTTEGTGDDDEAVRLPSGTADLVGALLAPAPGPAGRLVWVTGAVGGCGASTLAAALAVRAAPTGRTLLVEADPRGTGIDLVLGAEPTSGLRVEDVRAELGGPDPGALWDAVPAVVPGCGVLARARGRAAGGDGPVRPAGPAALGGVTALDGAAALGGALAPDGALGAALAHRGSGGLAVCDGGGFAGDGSVPGMADLVVVVTRADLSGAVAAGRAAAAGGELMLVVRTHRGDPLHAADVADAAGVPDWHVLPEIGVVRGLTGSGDLPGALRRGRAGRVRRLAGLADALLREVGVDGR